MSVRKDNSIDVLRLLENLKTKVQKPRSFMGITFGFDKDDLTMDIEKIRASMPKDVKDAASLAREREIVLAEAHEESSSLLDVTKRECEKMLEEAQIEATRLVETARLQHEQLVSEAEVLKIAKATADEIKHSAEREAREMRRGADKYAHDVLTNLENVVGRVLGQVEKGRAALEPSSERAVVSTEARDKVKS
ncbi:MAG: hypothetical protein MUC92_02490 [Fimbriimonadaceae bacterium]|jgi:cell division septum initiation protein DivIVA|nr:hypothetical protein [Fimbriimonadaceae bacterium]